MRALRMSVCVHACFFHKKREKQTQGRLRRKKNDSLQIKSNRIYV